jgi:hypothetical protein
MSSFRAVSQIARGGKFNPNVASYTRNFDGTLFSKIINSSVLMKRRTLTITIIAAILISSLLAGLLWFEIAGSKLYTYPISVGEKTYVITVVTNWNSAPKVDLSNSSLTDLKYVSVDFSGSCEKTVFFKITVPTDLLWGNISLIWKYYVQSSDRYILSNDGTHNSVQMTFKFTPNASGIGHFEIRGTEGAWQAASFSSSPQPSAKPTQQ